MTLLTAAQDAVAAGTVVASDSMSRTTTDGWGTADLGGAYSVTNPAPFSINGTYARVALAKPGESETATLGGVSARDVEIRFSVAVKSFPMAGLGIYSSPIVRAKDGHGYRVTLRFAPRAAAYLSIARIDRGTVTPVGSEIRLPHNAAPGVFLSIAFSASGDTTVALKAKVWRAGTIEPDWLLQVTDQSAQRVTAAGAVQLISSTSSSSGAMELWYDNLKVIDTTATTPTPTTTGSTSATATVPTAAPVPTTTPATATMTATTTASTTSTTAAGTTPTVSSASNSTGAAALTDGAVVSGQTGSEWVAAAGDVSPWAQLSYAAPHKIASIQAFGPTANWVNPTATARAPMYGQVSFSDGSSVIVSGIAGGGGSATTIAFAPRSVTWVRLQLMKTDAQVKFGLREFAAYGVGVTPPRWPTNPAPRYTAPSISAGTCSANSASFGSSADSSPALVCPKPGAVVNATTTVAVSAKPGTTLTASAWLPATNTVGTVGSVVANAAGRASFSIDMTRLTSGPTAVRVTTSSTADRPLYVQLDNASGIPLVAGDSAPSGMTLQWNDNFTSPISVSRSGAGADYAATKPSYQGGGDFGDAIFADPAWGLNTIATDDTNFLRIRLQPTGTMQDPNGWGRTHVAGIVSSMGVNASGFAAQYGYFEARMLAPAGYGSWPAFWMLNSENAANRETVAAEVDAVELYGQFPMGSCHSLHAWNGPGNSASKCPNPNGMSDWALSWHTYAAWVKPGEIDYYVDNKLIATIANPTLTNEPFFFMINEALGGGWPENLSATGDTADLYVDWVRVYT